MKLTSKQEEAIALLKGDQRHTMLFGGSRSGKTFIHVATICVRAQSAPGSRHAILRFRYNAVIASVLMDTFPKVMKLLMPHTEYNVNTQRGMVKFSNGSEIWFGGLDDKERTEKILGQEFATIFLNECSQIPLASRDLAVTRLAQKVMTNIVVDDEPQNPEPLKLRMLYDCNPPSKGHWTYKLFIKGVDPESNMPLPDVREYAHMQMNPKDNVENLPDGYIDTLQGLSARLQRRFLFGEFADENPFGLFQEEIIDKWRHLNGPLPDFQRVIVAVDPSGSGDEDNAENDAIGIVVAALGMDGNAYVVEDCTIKAGPAIWGNIVATAFDRHQADIVVAEANFGGAMVEMVIKSARPRTTIKMVTASRGKVIRAEPFSALYEQGKIRHIGYFRELEDELTAMSTKGYTGQGSPNRADALVWALTEIFPGIVNPRKNNPVKRVLPYYAGTPQSWMGV